MVLNRNQRAFKRKTFTKKKRFTRKVSRPLRSQSDLRVHQKIYAGYSFTASTGILTATPDTNNTSTAISCPSGGDSNILTFAMAFALADVPSYNNFVQMFDRFRIKSVSLRIIPTATVIDSSGNVVAGGGGGTSSQMITYDWDDNNPITTRTAMMNRERIKVHSGTKEITYKIRPRVQMDADSVQSVLTVSPWLNTSSNATLHYGIKYMVCSAVNSPSATNQPALGHVGFYLDYELEFKDVYSS